MSKPWKQIKIFTCDAEQSVIIESINKNKMTKIVGTFVKVRVGNELYVYFGGSLLYKRWIDRDHGKLLH